MLVAPRDVAVGVPHLAVILLHPREVSCAVRGPLPKICCPWGSDTFQTVL